MSCVIEEDVDVDPGPIGHRSVQLGDADAQRDLEFTRNFQFIENQSCSHVPRIEAERTAVATGAASSASSRTIQVGLRSERGTVLVHHFTADNVQNVGRLFGVTHLSAHDDLETHRDQIDLAVRIHQSNLAFQLAVIELALVVQVRIANRPNASARAGVAAG